MAAIFPFLMVAMVSLCGVCLSMPGDDGKEPWATSVAESTAHEGTKEPKAIVMPSLDMSAQNRRLQNSPVNILDFWSTMEKVLKHIFGFVDVVDKDSLLATDSVDESWTNWIQNVQQFLPVIPVKYVHSQDIENPQDDGPSPLWDYILALLLKGHEIVSIDADDTDGDEEEKVENAVTQTTVHFDPIGQLLSMMKKVAKSVTNSDSIMDWWERVKKYLKTFSVFSEEKTDATGKREKEFDDFGIFDYFRGEFSFGEFDLLKLALNFLAFVGFRSLFWRLYFPIPGLDDARQNPDFMQYDAYDEEEDGYYGNDEEEDEMEEDGYNQNDDGDDQGEEEEGYYQYDDGDDQGEEEEGYFQYDDDDQGDEEEGYYQYDDDDQGEEEGYYHYENNNNGKEEGYSQYDDDGNEDQHFDQGYGEGVNQGSYQRDDQRFDQIANQEIGHSATLGFLQSAYQDFGVGGNQGFNGGFEQGENHGLDQGINQGLDQGFDGLYQSSYQGENHGLDQGTNQGHDQGFDDAYQSSYQGYNEDFIEGYDQGAPQDGEDTDRRHTTGWPRPIHYNLSPEFNRGRYTYRNSQRRHDTHPSRNGNTHRGSNFLTWSNIYKNNYGYDQGSIYRQKYPDRNSYGYRWNNT